MVTIVSTPSTPASGPPWAAGGSMRRPTPLSGRLFVSSDVNAAMRKTFIDHNANIRVTGLRNDLRISSHNGSVEVADLDGAADIETHNGDVRVSYSRFSRSSSFETHNGGIDIRLPAGAQFHVNANGHH